MRTCFPLCVTVVAASLCGCPEASVTSEAETLAARGRILIGRGEFDDAVAALDAAIAASPEDADLYAERALAKERLGDDAAAEVDYTQALKIDPRHFRSLNDRAAVRARAGRFAEAIEDLSAAIEVQPTAALPYANRAQAAIDSGDAESALADLAAVQRIDPRDPLTPLRRGDALLMLERYEDALRAYDTAAQRDPQSAAAVRQQARTLVKLGRFADAAEAMAAAATLEPALAETDEAEDIATMRRVDAALRDRGMRLRADSGDWAAETGNGPRPLVVAADFDGRAVVDAEEVALLKADGGLLAVPSDGGYRVIRSTDIDLDSLEPASFYVTPPAETPPPLDG